MPKLLFVLARFVQGTSDCPGFVGASLISSGFFLVDFWQITLDQNGQIGWQMD